MQVFLALLKAGLHKGLQTNSVVHLFNAWKYQCQMTCPFKFFTICLLLFLVPLYLEAQSGQSSEYGIKEKFSRYQHYTMEQGLSNNSVNSIAQDADGFLWFGTEEGLNRFDGETFKQFFYRPAGKGLPSDKITALQILPENRLLVGTRKGLCVINTRFLTIEPVELPARPEFMGLDLYVVKILRDKAGRIWVGTFKGLYVLDEKLQTIQSRYAPNGANNRNQATFAKQLIALPDGTVAIKNINDKEFGHETWQVLDAKSEKLVPLAALHPEYGILDTAKQATSICFDKSNDIWFTALYAFSNTALYRFDWATHSTKALLKNLWPNTSDRNVNGQFWKPCFLPDSLLLLQRYFGSPTIYDMRDGTLTDLDAWKSSLPDGKFIEAFVDRDSNLWLCPTFEGIYFLTLKRPPVTPMAAVNKAHEKMMELLHTSGEWFGFSCLENKGRWILGCPAGGLYIMDKKNRGVTGTVLSNPFSEYAYVHKIFADRGDTIWTNTMGGLYWNDTANNTHGLLKAGFQGLDSLSDRPLFRDHYGLIWGKGMNNGICYFDTKTRQLTHFPSKGANMPFRLPTVSAIAEDPLTGDMWFRDDSENNYLVKWVRETNAFQKIIPVNNIPSTRLQVFMADNQGNLWVQTNDGLFFMNTRSLEVKAFGKKDGLNTNSPEDICIDKAGNIWFSTPNGLYRFDQAHQKWRTFYQADGLLSNDIKRTELLDTINNILLVSTSAGLCLFEPDKITTAPANTFINLLWASDSTYALPESNTWSLPYNRSDLRLEFSSINYLNGPRNTYQYSLEKEGTDDKWKDLGTNNFVNFLGLAPGKYTFQVRTTNIEGTEANQAAKLTIVIRPPWWQTWWAYLMYASLIGCSIFAFYRFQLKRRLERAETLRLQELDSVKTKLYTNITHEFRTPLTVILGMAKQVQNEIGNWKSKIHDSKAPELEIGKSIANLNMITRNGQNLLRLVNQMLDLSKLVSGKLSLHYQQGDVVNFLKYLLESFHSLAESKGVQLHFLADFEELFMEFDAERLQQIVSNLLSNAVKFTPAGGHVYFSVSSSLHSLTAHSCHALYLKIRDTGIGISEENLPYIFDRFYQVDDTHTRQGEGTGIGLTLTKELINLMEGDISVKSAVGKGTEFMLSLPIRQLTNTAANSEIMPMTVTETVRESNTEQSLPPAAADKPLLLLAEDNEDVVIYLASCLAEEYRLAIAKDGQECVTMALELIPDLLITDVMMPHKDGFEVCEILKNDEHTSHIPIIMLTAKADMGSKLEGIKRGADAYLVKPFHQEELLLRIEKLLELRLRLQNHYRLLTGLATEEPPMEDELPSLNVLEDYFVKKVRKVVDAHLADFDFTVETLCQEVGISHAQLHRKLTAVTGLSANKFIRSVRLSKAKELLSQAEITIASVAYDVGFNDVSYFSKVFKQEFGMTPMEWRERS